VSELSLRAVVILSTAEFYRRFQPAVVVASLPVGMMQVALHEIIHVISARHTLMTTLRTVNV
jgi:hypothetical protein